MKIYAVTDKGGKPENEDRIIVGKMVIKEGTFCFETDGGILAVADGVGGNNAGAVASDFVAEKLCEAKRISASIFTEINDELIQLSKENESYRGMATTLSGVMISDEEAMLFSVGNTRVYFLQSGKYLKQLTTDDTTLNYLISSGKLSREDIERFDRKNEITACFGGGNPNLLDIKISSIGKPASPILITSDGLHDYLSVDRIEEIIAEYEPQKALGILVKEARKNGSRDDISIIFGRN